MEDIVQEVFPLTRVDIPDVLRWKGKALHGLGQINESWRVLEDARSLAEKAGCHLHLWPILAELAEVQAKLGNHEAARLNRAEARQSIERIARSLRELGLHDSFLNQPRVRNVMGAG